MLPRRAPYSMGQKTYRQPGPATVGSAELDFGQASNSQYVVLISIG